MTGKVTVEMIRHGMTSGNREGRYIGSGTDEDLSWEGFAMAVNMAGALNSADVYLLSPMRRCLETALLMEGAVPEKISLLMEEQADSEVLVRELKRQLTGSQLYIVQDLRECHFGDFEGYNWQELSDNADYQKWIDSQGRCAFPRGEDQMSFTRRCSKAFAQIISSMDLHDSAQKQLTLRMIAHGGTIMALMDTFACQDDMKTKRSYFDWHVPNCGMIRSELRWSADGQIMLIPEDTDK